MYYICHVVIAAKILQNIIYLEFKRKALIFDIRNLAYEIVQIQWVVVIVIV